MELLKKLSYVFTACVFLTATACSSGTNSSATQDEPVEESTMEAMDSSSVTTDTVMVAADSVVTEADSTSAE